MVTVSKKDLRHAAREIRRTLAQGGFAQALARHAGALGIAPGRVVGGYHALAQEADPSLLLAQLAALGARIAFPRVAAHDAALAFHFIPPGQTMIAGAFGITEPLAHWPRAVPDVLLVPLLAFDGAGHRLGHGGGYYDRTLAALDARAIGVAYAGQEVSSLPIEVHDKALDGIVTEQGFRRFR